MQDSNELGSLFINLEAISTNAIKSLESAYKKIDRLEQSLDKINKTSLSGITNKFTTMAKAINRFNETLNDLSPLKTAGTQLSNFSKFITTVSNTDMSKLAKQFKQMNVAITPFLRTLQMNQPLLENFAKSLDFSYAISQYNIAEAKTRNIAERTKLIQINQKKANVQLELANKRLEKVNNTQDRLNKKTTFWTTLWKIGKLGYAIRVFRRIGNEIGKVINLSADFNESLNKFQSATQQYYKDAIIFANNLAESFGLARQTVLDYQSTFMNMLNALDGLGEGVANELSQSLTIMAIDYASLFNTTIESAMNAFQSMLSGRTMAIRTASGIDVTDNTIFEYYKELGGTKTRTALTQIEKRLLRIYAVYEQMNESFAVSDYAETIESFSNQARILTEQLEELGTWIGNIFIGVLKDFIVHINTIVIVLKEMAKSLAFAFGYQYQQPKQGLLEAITNEAGTATESVEELQNALGLLSIDKFEVLNSNSKQSASGDVEMITNAMTEQMLKLQKEMEGVEYKASQISKKVLDWLGYTKQVTDETGMVRRELGESYTNIEKLFNIVTSLITTLVSFKIAKVISGIDVINGKIKITQTLLNALNQTAVFVLIYSITTLLTQFDELTAKQKVIYSLLIGISTAVAIFSNEQLVLLFRKLSLFPALLSKIQGQLIGLSVAGLMVGASFAWYFMMDKFSAKTQQWVGAIMTLVGAFTSLAVAIMAVQGILTWGSAIPVLLGAVSMGAVGITSVVKGSRNINEYATGGFPETGELFIAREKGPEYVGSMGGRTTVANNQQITEGIKQASYQGMKQALAESSFSSRIVLDGSKVDNNALVRALYPAFKVEEKRNGGRGL